MFFDFDCFIYESIFAEYWEPLYYNGRRLAEGGTFTT